MQGDIGDSLLLVNLLTLTGLVRLSTSQPNRGCRRWRCGGCCEPAARNDRGHHGARARRAAVQCRPHSRQWGALLQVRRHLVYGRLCKYGRRLPPRGCAARILGGMPRWFRSFDLLFNNDHGTVQSESCQPQARIPNGGDHQSVLTRNRTADASTALACQVPRTDCARCL